MKDLHFLPNQIELLNYLAMGYAIRDMGEARKVDLSEYPLSHQTIRAELKSISSGISVAQHPKIIAMVLAKNPRAFTADYMDVHPIVYRKKLSPNEKDVLKRFANGERLMDIANDRQAKKSKFPQSFTIIQRTAKELRHIYKAKTNAQLIYKVVKLGHLELKTQYIRY